MRNIATAALAALLLAGCAAPHGTGEGPRVPESFAGSTGGTAARAAVDPWWMDFDDQSLDMLVTRSKATSLSLAAATERVREARALARQAGADLQPTLDGTAGVTRSGRDGVPATNAFEGSLRAAWEADVFGGRRAAVSSAIASVDAARMDENAARLALVADVADAYVDARGLQARIALAKETLGLQRQTLQVTSKKAEIGTVSSIDVTRAEALVAETEATIPALEGALRQSVVTINTLVDGDLRELLPAFKGRARVPSARRVPPTGVPAELVANRPDVWAARSRVIAAARDADVAEAALYPSLTVGGTLSLSAASAAGLASRGATGWSFGPQIDLPILDGGFRRASLEASRSRLRQSEIAWRQSVSSAVGEAEKAMGRLAAANAARVPLSRAEAANREALKAAKTLYDAGSSEFIDVLDAERSVRSSRDALLQNAVEIARAKVAVHRALGGGWKAKAGEVTLFGPKPVPAPEPVLPKGFRG